MFCREQVAQLRGELRKIRALGAELVVVGNGRPDQAKDFKKREKLTFPLFVDPDLEAYRAAGLKRSVLSAVGPKVMLHGFRAFRSGKLQGLTQGDTWQQGGVFVIQPNNKVLFSQRSEEAGDHADPADIIAVLDKAKKK